MNTRALFVTVIVGVGLAIGACSSSSTTTPGGGGGGGGGGDGGAGSGDSGGSGGGGDTGKQGDSCTCSGSAGSDFCQQSGTGSGCSPALTCYSYGGSSPKCATPCDSTSSASCPSGTSCTQHLEGSTDIGDWCE